MKRLSAGIALLAATTILATGCGSRAGDTDTATAAGCVDTSGPTVKVGAINSLSGGLAVSESVIHDAIVMAVEEINAGGGVLGKQLELLSEDGASEPTTFAEKAQKLVNSDCVAAVFGGYTSASRKAMLPVFENADALLYYGQQYEGLESSPNIYYTGATTNQQIIPALDYLKEQGVTSLYLVGSDYVFPRTSNAIVKAYAAANGIEIKGEDYVPLDSTNFSTIVNKIRTAGADAVFNVVVGGSLTSFFREYNSAGLTPEVMPVMSMCVGEEEVRSIGAQSLVGQLSSWNYYQTLDTPANNAFVADFKERFGADRVTSDPMESAYTAVLLWKAAVEKADSFGVADIQSASGGVSVDAPEGTVTIDGENHHVTKTARIGKVSGNGLIEQVWESPQPITPDPFLKDYPWAEGITG
ncbi:urea ABC transporter substrate-binding protein [Mycolicibacterium diernhoferi]|uniref:Urea ABC transporter substrate-binding protein n=1 Tax=Mycolicibacterium diernhoferi TaxID=1801 RepID=A0A1Q4H6P5_9MYCO|nr:urea ABC transporter substrate-binding protein [Mycolicibacterium diernhoferi]OJZ63051.1 urea ABC transporter substrate-binding protein [Mycolicibacterium diernhoferi]OPE54155.1 urea ABC transporter substrate-binding protein [Mycolicibacterium diernhoferi]PEG53126.1 urea ABC transporter substrate-binding protein [Mycolicibacterium diernhoferi]QYL22098.1 urea ABC transporter substrate-binding protein [Mycolicibacterium diernhoferi]